MIRFVAIDTDTVRALQAGGPDANDQAPEHRVSDGSAVPCRHCLGQVPAGEPFLVLAHRPFPAPQPYAEQGPIFLHAEACERHRSDGSVPAMFASAQYILRGYSADDRIVYGTGRIVPTPEIPAVAETMLEDPTVAYLHARSASNNCFQCRIERW